MVLWEITLGTAYFLGLKRTYKLALKIQRRLISAKHEKLRGFLHRRTRAIFDIALKVHLNIQQRDLEVGRNVGNWILRWLDRAKPSAQIRGDGAAKQLTSGTTNVTKHTVNSSHRQALGKPPSPNYTNADQKSDGRVFATALNIRSKAFPTLSTMMPPFNPIGANTQFRHLSICSTGISSNYGRSGFDGVIRKDIMAWMLRN